MLKKLSSICLSALLALSLVGCNSDNDKPSKPIKKTEAIHVKTTEEFKESDGLVKYFTIEDYKFSIPETVGEYANYLSQLGTVTLNDTGESVDDVTLNAEGISSMAAYLSVTTENGEEQRFNVRYENPTKNKISVSEASITYLEVKYDALSQQEYEKVFTSIEVITNEYTFELNDKKGFKKFYDELGTPIQNTDGRLDYVDDLGYKYTFDCCNENRNGVFRGFIIKYPNSKI